MHFQRPHRSRSGQLGAAEAIAEALLDLREEARVVERHDRPALRLLLRPRDAGAIALQRQDRKWTGRQEVLHRARAVRFLVADRGDNADLPVFPADEADTRRLAQPRCAPVCGHQKRRAQATAVCKRDRDAMLVGHIACGGGTAQEGDGRPLHGRREDCGHQAVVLHDIGGGLAALYGVVVGHEDGTECVVERCVGDVDRRHGFGMLGDRRPYAQRRQHVLRSCRHGRSANIAGAGRAAERHTVDDRDPCRRAERIGQRTGERKTDGTAAGDDDVAALFIRLHYAYPGPSSACLTDVAARPPLCPNSHRGSYHADPKTPSLPAPSRTCSPFWTWSNSKITCFAAAARNSPGSACSGDRLSARPWWPRYARCRPSASPIRCTPISCSPAT